MARLPSFIDHRLWRLSPRDRKKAYSVLRPSPGIVEVLEEGRKVLHRAKVTPKAPGEYVLVDDWLVHRTFPRVDAAYRKEKEREAAAKTRSANAIDKAERAPKFQVFLDQLTRELGKPRIPKTLRCRMRAFRAPDDARCLELVQQARAAGGAATLYLAPWARELRVVAGRVSQLAELFLGPHELEAVFDALDRDAGLTLEYVATDIEQYSLRIDRAPKRIATYRSQLQTHLVHDDPDDDPVATLRRELHLDMGPPTSEWTRRSKTIREPITGPESDDW
ncbi:MAG: hypothetical protein IPQ07_40920 [Myxococcales bacterium]|nr:hypothetical protein [Myxococcales bacterium]